MRKRRDIFIIYTIYYDKIYILVLASSYKCNQVVYILWYFICIVTLLWSKETGKDDLIGSIVESFIIATDDNYTKILILARVENSNIQDLR